MSSFCIYIKAPQFLSEVIMKTINDTKFIFIAVLAFFSISCAPNSSELFDTYDKLLPLEGGSNFRDMGGYTTESGKTLEKGLIFRSGSMVSLTETDMDYLDQFDFETIIDLRSSDELELFPNYWAQHSGINYINDDYSILSLMAGMTDLGLSTDEPEEMMQEFAKLMSEPGELADMINMESIYSNFPQLLKPQLTLLFNNLLEGKTPLVVNCSAGQDRTGLASGLILSALGVPKETIYQDYLLSTEYRRPSIERGNVDLAKAAQTNAFAAIMLKAGGTSDTAEPLYGEDGVPFLSIAFESIENQYGSVLAYLKTELDVDESDIETLRNMYLK